MIQITLLLLFAFLPTLASADSDWICKEAASIRVSEDALMVCGIGEADNEADARLEALRRAKEEFEGICEDSADCKNHALNLIPLRNSCEQTPDKKFKCYRGLKYEIVQNGTNTSDLEQQKKRLDLEISQMLSRLKDLQEVRAKETHLEALKRRVAGNGVVTPPSDDAGLMLGIQFLGVSTPTFQGESVNGSFGLGLSYHLCSWVGLEVGGNLDVYSSSFSPAGSPAATPAAAVGYDVYGGVPVYLKEIQTNPYGHKSAVFLEPEIRHFEHSPNQKTGLGVSLGWQNLVKLGDGGWGAKVGVSDIVDFGALGNPAVNVGISYIFGL